MYFIFISKCKINSLLKYPSLCKMLANISYKNMSTQKLNPFHPILFAKKIIQIRSAASISQNAIGVPIALWESGPLCKAAWGTFTTPAMHLLYTLCALTCPSGWVPGPSGIQHRDRSRPWWCSHCRWSPEIEWLLITDTM